ncbi:MAG: sensor histidine kinase [Rubrivivax sp.]|jgi:signal transduction histidine kinase
MRSRLLPPGRAATVSGPVPPLALLLASTPLMAPAQTQAAATTSGPWLLASVLLVLAVVAGLSCALGFAWGRYRVAQSATSRQTGLPAGTPHQRALDATTPSSAATADSKGTDSAADTESAQSLHPPEPTQNDSLTFSYTLAHDLRAPVRVVDGFARILKEDYSRQLDRIGNDHLDRILSAAARMNAMIDAMLSLAQLTSQPLARQPVNLSQLADYILEDLRRAHPGRVVQTHIQPNLQVLADPTLMRQLMENLLSNAWKYTGRTAVAQIHLQSTLQDGQRVFEVRDNGAGFDMRSAERLFGLFQRLHSANDFPGTGVGLASVQRIVRRHGGDVWAESHPGQGSRFWFTIRN